MPAKLTAEEKTNRHQAIITILKGADSCVTSTKIASELGLNPPAVRAALVELVGMGKAFVQGNRRSCRYGSTQKKADASPFVTA